MNSSKWWFYILLISPFINILNYRIGEYIGLAILIVLMSLFVITSNKKHLFTINEKKLYRIIVFSLFFILLSLYFSFVYSLDNFYYFRFFCLSFFLMPLFLLYGDSESFIRCKLLSVLKYYIVLISMSIVVGTLLKMVGLDHLEPMYDASKHSYLGRPFGILGQPSVNSCLICFFYLFYRSAAKKWIDNFKSKSDWLFWVVTVGVILQGSGSGYISFVIVLLGKLSGRRNKITKSKILFIMILLLSIFYWVAKSGFVGKISFEYIEILNSFVNDNLIEPYKSMIRNDSQLLWGVKDFPLSIDLGPLYMMGTIGLVMTLFIFSFLIYVTIKCKSFDLKLGLILLLIGNFHYPVMFYMIMHFMWFIIIYYIFVIEKTPNYNQVSIAKLSQDD